jgi:hypothetical protein
MKRIKHNDLLPWFTMDHDQLPMTYLTRTQNFFDERQAPSRKRQATSLPQSGVTITKTERKK